MAKKPLPLRIDADLMARVDERRRVLGQTRTLFVERALEAALGGQRSGDTRSVSSPRESGSAKETAPTESLASPRVSSPKLPPGVRPAREFVLDPRQAALNKAKGS